MAEDANDKAAGQGGGLDLSELRNLDFGPDWSSGKGSGQKPRQDRAEAPRPREGQSPRKDRRPARPPRSSPSEGEHPGDRHPPRRGRDARQDPGEFPRDPFRPTVRVAFYPEDKPFRVLTKAIRESIKTYELFQIAQLILAKEDRFVVTIEPFKEGDEAVFAISVPDHLPFMREEDAVAHVIANHLDRFFVLEEVEVDPPKGNFPFINRCGITGELLGPPNYHRYQAIIQQHHASRLPNMPFERFESKIEQVKDEETLARWMEQMSKSVRYRVKEPREGEPEILETPEAVRQFLLAHRRDEVVKSSPSARFPGKDIVNLPQGDIRRSVEAALDYQRRFPLDTANNLRGRLRRMKFAIFKRGSKGVTYVCAVKRVIRDENTRFSDSIEALIDFIEKHPNLHKTELPAKHLGIDMERPAPSASGQETGSGPEAAATAAPDATQVPASGENGTHVPASGAQSEAASATSDPDAAASQPASPTPPADTPPPAGAVGPPDEASSKAPAENTSPAAALAPEDQRKLRQLMADLQWLVSEGYVTEYEDGTLFAPPPQPAAKPKAAETSQQAETLSEPAEQAAEPAEATQSPEEPEAASQQAEPESEPAEATEPPPAQVSTETPQEIPAAEAGQAVAGDEPEPVSEQEPETSSAQQNAPTPEAPEVPEEARRQG